jgi:hypothetical protein
MKKFLIVAGLLTAIATPAFAQSYVPEYGTANELPFAYGPNTSVSGAYDSDSDANAAFAQEPKSMQNKQDASQSPAEDITEGPSALREFRD